MMPRDPNRDDLIIPGGLCFVQNDYAYFTTQPVTLQYGDDWRKIYYEGSGAPDFKENYLINRVQFDSGLLRGPLGAQNNPELSVQDFNKGLAPWLSTRYGEMPKSTDKLIDVNIFAGCNVIEFQRDLEKAYGSILIPITRSRNFYVGVRNSL